MDSGLKTQMYQLFIKISIFFLKDKKSEEVLSRHLIFKVFQKITGNSENSTMVEKNVIFIKKYYNTRKRTQINIMRLPRSLYLMCFSLKKIIPQKTEKTELNLFIETTYRTGIRSNASIWKKSHIVPISDKVKRGNTFLRISNSFFLKTRKRKNTPIFIPFIAISHQRDELFCTQILS